MSAELRSISIVVPMYNEGENVDPLADKLSSALSGWGGGVEIVFVNDGSSDATLERLKRRQQSDTRIRIVHLRRNHGQSAAMAAGFKVSQGDAVVTLDGDLQNDPADILRLVPLLDEWDCVCGVRALRKDSWWKKISSRIGNGFRNWATGDDIVDTGCTLKAFRRECVAHLDLFNGMHRFLPTLLKMRGYRVTQIPVNHHPRVRGETKYGTWGRMTKGLKDVWAVRWMKKNYLDYQSDLEVIEPRASEIPPERRSEGSAVYTLKSNPGLH